MESVVEKMGAEVKLKVIEEYAKRILAAGRDYEADPEFTPMDYWGCHVDDCYSGGKDQAMFLAGRFLLDVLSK